MKKMHLLPIILLCFSCSGPYTPVGPVNTLTPPEKNRPLGLNEALLQQDPTGYTQVSDKFSVKLYPQYQFYHTAQTTVIEMKSRDPAYSLSSLKIVYQGRDITKHVISNSKVQESKGVEDITTISIPHVRFAPEKRHNLVFTFEDAVSLSTASLRFSEPVCTLENINAITNTMGFNPPKSFLETIKAYSTTRKVNPALVAGLIAGESSFNPKAVSWAKAIGLTQITPLAAEEIDRKGKSKM